MRKQSVRDEDVKRLRNSNTLSREVANRPSATHLNNAPSSQKPDINENTAGTGHQQEDSADDYADVEIQPAQGSTDRQLPITSELARDSVAMYLREISRVSLLTADDEVELGKRIAEGQEALMMLEKGVTNEADLLQLTSKIAAGEEARLRLVRANLRLVVSIAKRYIGTGLSFGDLIQEGNFGLLRAAEKFDYRRGFKFSTYATWWIKQGIHRAITEHSRAIRLPAYMADQVRRQGRTRQKLQQDMGREPTAEELALELDLVDEEEKAAIREALQNGDSLPSGLREELRRAIAKVELVERISQDPLSLEAPIAEGEENIVGDFVHDRQATTMIDSASQTMLCDQMRDILGGLTERERQVIELRFGLNGEPGRTLENIGEMLGISRERVRQIEAKALRKLRQPSRSARLRDYLV